MTRTVSVAQNIFGRQVKHVRSYSPQSNNSCFSPRQPSEFRRDCSLCEAIRER
jgi:hypothetical protein